MRYDSFNMLFFASLETESEKISTHFSHFTLCVFFETMFLYSASENSQQTKNDKKDCEELKKKSV